jgi:hypothetical protein
MHMIKRFRAGLLLTATAGALGITSVVAGSANATTTSFTASTAVSNRSDSGGYGTWAMDSFTRNATIVFRGLVVQSHCQGIAPGNSCYSWTGTIKDSGTFTTVVGATSPGQGGLNGAPAPGIGTAVTGPMSGQYKYVFYTDQPSTAAAAANMPATVSGDIPATGQWVEQFFSGGVTFWDSSNNMSPGSLGTSGGWTYIAAFGSDTACPNVASKWVDASISGWGGTAASGNILAPDSLHC